MPTSLADSAIAAFARMSAKPATIKRKRVSPMYAIYCSSLNRLYGDHATMEAARDSIAHADLHCGGSHVAVAVTHPTVSHLPRLVIRSGS
jgi:hypothetical protein